MVAALNTSAAALRLRISRTVRQRAQQLERGLQGLVREHGLVAERGVGLLRALVLPHDRADAVVTAAARSAPVWAASPASSWVLPAWDASSAVTAIASA